MPKKTLFVNLEMYDNTIWITMNGSTLHFKAIQHRKYELVVDGQIRYVFGILPINENVYDNANILIARYENGKRVYLNDAHVFAETYYVGVELKFTD